MAEVREIPAGTYNLKFGDSFCERGEKPVYHTLRCMVLSVIDQLTTLYISTVIDINTNEMLNEIIQKHLYHILRYPSNVTEARDRIVLVHTNRLFSYSLLLKNTFPVDFKPKSLAGEKETFIAFGGNGDVQVALSVCLFFLAF